MNGPHDRPTAEELLEAVREWMERDLGPALSGPLAFHARVASNILAMVGREVGSAQDDALVRERAWDSLGVSSDEELSARIVAGDFDGDMRSLIGILRPVIEAKVRVANPRHLED